LGMRRDRQSSHPANMASNKAMLVSKTVKERFHAALCIFTLG
jgi:hypothetical protein